MALLRCDFFSDVLGLSTTMTVILPERPSAAGDAFGSSGDAPPAVLYLLHGLSDDATMWSRFTSIERYVNGRNLAVVMPDVDTSFYTDAVHGRAYWTFLTSELPQVVHRLFRVSDRREDTFVAGLSMGGYGAMKWALREPWRFAAAASLSGALGLSHPNERAEPDFARLLHTVFGDVATDGTQDDVRHLLRTADPQALPRLYVACGTEDFLYWATEAFVELARETGVELTIDIGPGDHDWPYWDEAISRVVNWLPA